jgi:glycosyltransferase involved in cell wall biosynthesis
MDVPLVLSLHEAVDPSNRLVKFGLRHRPDLILCNSEHVLRSAEAIFPGVPRRLVRNPLTIASPSIDFDRGAVRKALGADDKDVVIICHSRLEPWKGHSLLLSALKLLNEEEHWKCWIVGGPQRESEYAYFGHLQQQAIQFGLTSRVTFLGQRSDVGTLLQSADIHCQPNTGPEPFGNAFVEALASRLPVVTTAMGGALEIVDETCGRLVQPDPESLVKALLDIVRDGSLRAELSVAGPARARALSDPQVQMDHYAAAIREAVDRHEAARAVAHGDFLATERSPQQVAARPSGVTPPDTACRRGDVPGPRNGDLV